MSTSSPVWEGLHMPDNGSTSNDGRGTATIKSQPAQPGLLRSIAHRLVGDADVLPVEGRLPTFEGATGWLNSEPSTPAGLRGRVVLVDFWTYTCINWLRTAPYIRAWDEKYRDQGLTVIGAHTPEFGFEGNVDNVIARTKGFGVEYPVAIDTEYGVWQAFANHFWPAVYIADAEGRIRYHHFGEGEYAMTEMVVQQLLLESGADGVDPDLVSVDPQGFEVAADWTTLRSPRRTSASVEAPALRLRHPLDTTSRTTTPSLDDSTSTSGRRWAGGRSHHMPRFSTPPRDASPSGTRRETSIS